MRKQRRKSHKGLTVLTVLLAFLTCVSAACLSTPGPGGVSEAMVAWVHELNALDPAWASSMIEYLDRSREESRYEESVRESVSIAESISAAEESRSIEESIRESSIEESRSIEESIRESAAEEAERRAAYAEAVAAARDMAEHGGNGDVGPMEEGRVTVIGSDSIPEIRELFADTVIIGNMQAKGVLDTGILASDTVLYKWYAHMDEISGIVDKGASLGRKKVLFIMGVNDIGYYQGNVEGWKQEYVRMINRFRDANPEAEVYLQEILQISEAYSNRWHNYYRIPTYNEALREVASSVGATVVSAKDFAFQGFLCDETGAQYDKRFHFFWAQTMAIQMGLWED